MITRISKIARLPKQIREQLNQRLDNGEMGRTILPWLNELPETKTVVANLFAGKPVTHQNLSEWRHAGYQDWLQHQQRLEWLDRFTEQETELEQHDTCGDTYEAFGRLFLLEIGQDLAALQKIKNPADRSARMQNLMREFCRLQNAYNWSRRVALEWDKYKEPFEDPEDSENPAEEIEETESLGAPASRRLEASNSSDAIDVPELPNEPESQIEKPVQPELPKIPATFQPIPTSPPPTPLPADTLWPKSPSFPTQNSQTQNSQTPKPHHSPPPIRGRRFVCVEG